MRRHARLLALLPLILVADAASAAKGELPSPVQPVIEAERAFAARAQVVDARDAFVENFAPDAVAFHPAPGPAFPGLTQGGPWGTNIRWRPVDGGIAQSGDLGWTTGPAEYRRDRKDAAPFRWGHYTSLWAKQADGTWKVVADIGIDHAPPADAVLDKEADWEAPRHKARAFKPWVAPPRGPSSQALLDGVLAADKSLAIRAGKNAANAFRGALLDDARVHKAGQWPALGANAALGLLRDGAATYSWTAAGGRVAASGDLGATWGSGAKQTTTGPEPFHYLAIWEKRDAAWKLRVLVQISGRTP